jgi:hypothetical protein
LDPRSEPSAIPGLGLWFLEMRGCWLGSFNHLATKHPQRDTLHWQSHHHHKDLM